MHVPFPISTTVNNHVEAINALSAKIAKAESKIDQYQRSIGQHIAAIKKARPDDWVTVVKTECNLSRTRAYELMAIADNTKTSEQICASADQRKLKHRGNSVRSGTDSSRALTVMAASAEGMNGKLAKLETAPGEHDDEEPMIDLMTIWQTTSTAGRKELIGTIPVPFLLELLTQAQIDELKDRLLRTETPVIGPITFTDAARISSRERGMAPGLTNDPKKNDIPLFLQVQNRKPLTPEQKASLDEKMAKARAQ
jgi:hypothetical protein